MEIRSSANILKYSRLFEEPFAISDLQEMYDGNRMYVSVQSLYSALRAPSEVRVKVWPKPEAEKVCNQVVRRLSLWRRKSDNKEL